MSLIAAASTNAAAAARLALPRTHETSEHEHEQTEIDLDEVEVVEDELRRQYDGRYERPAGTIAVRPIRVGKRGE